MTAFLIASIVVHSVDWLADYVANVPPIVRSHDGVYLGISKASPLAIKLVEGTIAPPDALVIITFPSMDAATGFLEGPAYAPYRAARRAGTESNFWLFENNDDAPQFIGQ